MEGSVSHTALTRSCNTWTPVSEEDVDEPELVPIIQPLRLLLDAIKLNTPPGSSPEYVGGALDLDNLSDRVIKPIFEAHGLEWKGWHAYHRGLATNLKELGVEDTTIQSVMRHENVTTTQRFYIRTALRVAHDAMQKLAAKITGTPLVHQAILQ